jgi:chromosome partitioning protein
MVGLSYDRPGAEPSGPAWPGANGLGWPDGSPGRPRDVRPAAPVRGIGGLGWPDGSGREARGVQVVEGRSAAEDIDVPGGSRDEPDERDDRAAAAGEARGPEPVRPADSRPVVVPEIPPDLADTPIARAAGIAVGVRGKNDREPWPRPPRCRIMTIANQKGGVGKTTTAVNLAASLAQHGSRVLVVDLDPQGNASTALDVPHHAGVPSVYDVLIDERPLAEVVGPAGDVPGLYCAPATIDLAGAEIELVSVVARELRLARALRAYDTSGLDYVLVDCPPSLGLLTLNALVAAEEVLLPIQCEYYALEGVQQLLNTAELVRVNFNPGLHVSTVLLTMYDGRTRLASDVADDVRAHFGTSVLSTIIPRSVRVSEAPSRGQSVISYDPASSGAIAYTEAARELAMQSAAAR